MGQFSVTIYGATGSVLSDNQQGCFAVRKCLGVVLLSTLIRPVSSLPVAASSKSILSGRRSAAAASHHG